MKVSLCDCLQNKEYWDSPPLSNITCYSYTSLLSKYQDYFSGLGSKHPGWRLSEELQGRAKVLALCSKLWTVQPCQLYTDNISPSHSK